MSLNSGMFLFSPAAFLGEADRVAPDLAAAARAAVAEAPREGDAILLGEAFLKSPAVPVDVAVFEKTDKAQVVAADIGWSDVGAFDALWAEAAKDDAGNVLQGPAIAAESSGSLVVSDGPTVVLAGVADLAVIVENGVVLVTRRDAPAAVRAAVEAVKQAGREDLLGRKLATEWPPRISTAQASPGAAGVARDFMAESSVTWRRTVRDVDELSHPKRRS